jgi:hypothetical protein
MKRWALLVVLLYAVAIVAFTVPTAFIAFVQRPGKQPDNHEIAQIVSGIAVAWQFWTIIGVLAAAQTLLLAVPVRRAAGRPVGRRSVWATAAAAGFAVGLLILGALSCVFETITKLEWGPDDSMSRFFLQAVFVVAAGSWLFWTVVFARQARAIPPDDWTARLFRRLYVGSIAELLVAVPTHIVARVRDYCCAGFMTFIGIACGIAVLLMAYGPAVFFLFVARWRRLHPVRTADGAPAAKDGAGAAEGSPTSDRPQA